MLGWEKGIRTNCTWVLFVMAQLLVGTAAEESFCDKTGEKIVIRNGVFASFVQSNEDWLHFTKPGNRERYQVEWETVDNMKVHYENFEQHMLVVGIAKVNPNYDPESKAANVNDVDHQRILIKESERHRVNSFNEAGWSPELMDAGNEKIIAGLGEFMPTVYSTKSSRRLTFVGVSTMDSTDLPQFTIFPVRPKASWVTGAPKCQKLGDDGQPLKARFNENDSGGMTNTMMENYFLSVIKTCRFPVSFFIPLLLGLITDQK